MKATLTIIKVLALGINNNDIYDLMKFLRFERVYIFHYLLAILSLSKVCLSLIETEAVHDFLDLR
jgi:hypothetical protein